MENPNADDIMRTLEKHVPQRIEAESLQRAAVLLPLFKKDDEWHILFTKRSMNLPQHAGEVSFPGGALDEGEKAVDAALRETFEEVGVHQKDVQILGRLNDLFTLTQYRVSPFVGVIPYPYKFSVSEHEIEEVFDVSVSALMDHSACRRGQWMFGGHPYPLFFFEGGKHTIWGVTGKILKQFLEIVFDWKEPS